MRKTIILMAVPALLICSCQKEQFKPQIDDSTGTIPVNLSLSYEGMEYACETKSVVDDDSEPYTPIMDVNVFQFITDSQEDTSTVRWHRYMPGYNSGKPGAHTVQLVASKSPRLIVFVANIGDSLKIESSKFTLGDLKKMVRIYTKGSSAPETYMMGEFGDGEFYPMLNGSLTPEKLVTGATLNCTLKRNIARLDIKIANKTENVFLDSVAIRRVPARSAYYTNWTGFYDKKPVPAPGSGTIDYNPVPWSSGKEEPGNDTRSFRFYVPANMQGEFENMHPTLKTRIAPPDATRCVVYARYEKDGDMIPVNYTFVLGENSDKDCNLYPNTAYDFTFDIIKEGDRDLDGRVQDWGPVDFTQPYYERSNCYILNPSPLEGQYRRFRIPIDRILEFWGYGKSGSGHFYEDNEKYAMTGPYADSPWSADVVWTDFNNADSLFVFKKHSGKGNKDYFEVAVKSGLEGNALIKVCNSDGDILWSWHLWITDYMPDEALSIPVKTDQYTYPVTGGDVHRHSNEAFKTGIYKDSFIMDRNLGASYPAETSKTFRYQFGRKDPLPNIKVYDEAGNKKAYDSSTDANICNVSYSVNHPFTELTNGENWISSSHQDHSQYVSNISYSWNDPYTTASKGEKSIFDPCPPGWSVPYNNSTLGAYDYVESGYVWYHYHMTNHITNASNVRYLHPWDSDGKNLPDTFIYPKFNPIAAANSKHNTTRPMHLREYYSWNGSVINGGLSWNNYTTCNVLTPARCIKTPVK